LIAMNLRVSFE